MPDFDFHGGGVDIAHHHQRRPIGPVIGPVVIMDKLHGGIADDVGFADRGAHGRTPAGEPRIHDSELRAILRRVAQPLLRQNDAAFAIEGAGIEGQLARRLAHQHQARRNRVGIDLGQIELIDSFVIRGMGVDVRPIGQALALQDADHLPFGDIRRTLEGHVLEKMRQTLLVVVFVERTGANAKTDRCLSGRRGIAHDRKPHSIGERAEMDIGVGLEIAF